MLSFVEIKFPVIHKSMRIHTKILDLKLCLRDIMKPKIQTIVCKRCRAGMREENKHMEYRKLPHGEERMKEIKEYFEK